MAEAVFHLNRLSVFNSRMRVTISFFLQNATVANGDGGVRPEIGGGFGIWRFGGGQNL